VALGGSFDWQTWQARLLSIVWKRLVLTDCLRLAIILEKAILHSIDIELSGSFDFFQELFDCVIHIRFIFTDRSCPILIRRRVKAG